MSRSEDALDDPSELQRLQGELLDRFDAIPFRCWPAALLRTLIAAFDLAGIDPVPPPVIPRRLRVVR